jgi:putative membrane protein
MKRLIKLMSMALCLSIVLSASLVGVFALSLDGVSIGKKDTATPDEADLFKDETVYVMAKADGSVDKIIVSDWIRNNKKATTVKDVAALADIENVKTDASFTLDSDNMRVWQADGSDLYLQGTGTEPLPVDLSVTYSLNGKVTTPEEIEGKSGKVTIRFDYTNNAYETVKINGKEERIYVPFLMMSGMILDGEKFSDVTVTNGKVVSDGDRKIVAGIAFPGLQHDLGLSREDINIPDYFEVTADAKDFALGTTVTIATNGLTKDLDPDDLDSLDKLNDSLGTLESAMSALVDGSSQLYTGLDTLLSKSGELTSGVEALYDGASQLSEGAEQVDNGAKQLSDGANTLSNGTVTIDLGALNLSAGLSELTSNNSALTNGSDMTFTSILATARKALQDAGLDVPELTPDNYAAVLNSLLEQLSDKNVTAQATAVAKEKVTAAVEANRDTIISAVTDAVRQTIIPEVEAGVKAQVTAKVLSTMGYSVEDYNAAVAAGLVDEATQSVVNGAIETQMNSDEVKATVNALVEQNLQGETAQAAIKQNTEAKIAELIEQNMQSEEVQQGIAEALAKAKSGRENIESLKAQLDSYNTFNSGLKTYTDGVGSASAGAAQLHSGTSQLKDGSKELKDGASSLKEGTSQLSGGAEELKNGVLTLKDGVPALVDGVSRLREGSMQLSDGLKQFSDEGISKITSLLKDNVGDLGERIKAIIKVSQNYKSYSGLTEGMDGEVKFIYKTDEIGK